MLSGGSAIELSIGASFEVSYGLLGTPTGETRTKRST